MQAFLRGRDRLPGLAAELVQRQVAVIVGPNIVMSAARAATSTIPIVFVSGCAIPGLRLSKWKKKRCRLLRANSGVSSWS